MSAKYYLDEKQLRRMGACSIRYDILGGQKRLLVDVPTVNKLISRGYRFRLSWIAFIASYKVGWVLHDSGLEQKFYRLARKINKTIDAQEIVKLLNEVGDLLQEHKVFK